MSMNGNQLGDELYAAVISVMEDQNTSGPDVAKARWREIGTAIVSHIQRNATITPLTTTSSPGGDPTHIHNPVTVTSTGHVV
jgi:hypothetical protein